MFFSFLLSLCLVFFLDDAACPYFASALNKARHSNQILMSLPYPSNSHEHLIQQTKRTSSGPEHEACQGRGVCFEYKHIFVVTHRPQI